MKNTQTFTIDDWSLSNSEWGHNNSDISALGNRAATLISRISVDEESGNELRDVGFVEAESCIATAEIEPDDNEPITVDFLRVPSNNLINLLERKSSSPKVSYSENPRMTPLQSDQ